MILTTPTFIIEPIDKALRTGVIPVFFIVIVTKKNVMLQKCNTHLIFEGQKWQRELP